MSEVRGRTEPGFDAVRAVFEQNVSSGEELGASLVVDLDGERVVDLWGGFRDSARTTPWDEHTITNVWSSTPLPQRHATAAVRNRAYRRSGSRGRASSSR